MFGGRRDPGHLGTLRAAPHRQLFIPGGCPSPGDPCSALLQSGTIEQGSVSTTCAGLGSGPTYAPSTCQFGNATSIGVSTYILNGTCVPDPPDWPATVSENGRLAWVALAAEVLRPHFASAGLQHGLRLPDSSLSAGLRDAGQYVHLRLCCRASAGGVTLRLQLALCVRRPVP